MDTISTVSAPRFRGRLLLFTGLALAFAVIGIYAWQMSQARLTAPWYVPIATTVGVLFCLMAVGQRRSVWRILALVFLLLLGGAEWAFMFALRYAPYSGPAVVGQPFPAFATSKADGSPFTQADLQGNGNTAIVFFRGRW